MAYDEELDGRIAKSVAAWGNGRKKMFGGTCHLLNGNMLCGVYKDLLIVRLGHPAAAEALEKPYVKPFDITGRPMKGWVMVEAQGIEGANLGCWLERARSFVETLPAKGRCA